GKIKDHSTLIELKVEESGKELKYLMEQKFVEHDTRLKCIEAVVNEVSCSQDLLTETLLKFIENVKKGKSSGGSGRG
ncbi:hypothetical protein Dimus_020557, partial [Dionaea muscipula]